MEMLSVWGSDNGPDLTIENCLIAKGVRLRVAPMPVAGTEHGVLEKSAAKLPFLQLFIFVAFFVKGKILDLNPYCLEKFILLKYIYWASYYVPGIVLIKLMHTHEQNGLDPMELKVHSSTAQ